MTKARVVPDTNIIISAIFWRGRPYEFMRSAIESRCQLILSKPILSEVSDKLRIRFGVPENKIEEYKRILLARSKLVSPSIKIRAVKSDPSDRQDSGVRRGGQSRLYSHRRYAPAKNKRALWSLNCRCR